MNPALRVTTSVIRLACFKSRPHQLFLFQKNMTQDSERKLDTGIVLQSIMKDQGLTGVFGADLLALPINEELYEVLRSRDLYPSPNDNQSALAWIREVCATVMPGFQVRYHQDRRLDYLVCSSRRVNGTACASYHNFRCNDSDGCLSKEGYVDQA